MDEEPELSKETLKAIKEARKRFKKGISLTEEEAMVRLGIED